MTDYAFGIDISRYDSNNGLMDFSVVAQHEPKVRFIAIRSSISWGYKDPFFLYHWREVGKMDNVGRLAYHVLYPGENVQKQADNWFEALENPNWSHDRLVIDSELDHNQSKTRITDATNELGEICRSRTGMMPLLYSRRYWMLDHYDIYSLNKEFLLWLAQYRWPADFPAYTDEYEPPPQTYGLTGFQWLVHQTGDHCKPIGVTGNKHYQDYNRWNNEFMTVDDYFGFDDEVIVVPPPELTLEERVERLEKEVFGE